MAGETVITVVGNLTSDPELRFTSSGNPVANFTVASTPRVMDRQSGQFRDGEPLFLRCSVWRDYAEHVSESLTKGTRVVVQGRLKQRSYETQNGEKRTSMELEVEEVGPSLRYATAQVTRVNRGGNAGGYNQDAGKFGQQAPMQQQQPMHNPNQPQGQPQPQAQPQAQPQVQRQQAPMQQPAAAQGQPNPNDPWATGPSVGANNNDGGANWGGSFDEEPPF